MPSNYEKAIAVRNRNAQLIEDFENQICDSHRDKTGLRWLFAKRSDGSQIVLTTEMYHGYYGSSSVSSDASDAAAIELAKTLSGMKDQVISLTVARLKAEITAAMKDAADEAKSILAEAATTA